MATFFCKLQGVKINRTIGHISIAIVQDLLHHFDLLRDVSGSTGFDTGRQHVENAHHIMETHRVLVGDLHWLQLLQACAFAQFVFSTGIHIAFQVTYICHVAHIAYLVIQELQVAVDDVEANESATIAQMNIAVYSWPTYIHPDPTWVNGLEDFFLFAETVVNF